ncbi:hypothetical protein AGIG_G18731 [Arapaima gigas]
MAGWCVTDAAAAHGHLKQTPWWTLPDLYCVTQATPDFNCDTVRPEFGVQITAALEKRPRGGVQCCNSRAFCQLETKSLRHNETNNYASTGAPCAPWVPCEPPMAWARRRVLLTEGSGELQRFPIPSLLPACRPVRRGAAAEAAGRRPAP